MKKLHHFSFVLILLTAVFFGNLPVASAGGYCPTSVKIAANTPPGSVFHVGDTFLASVFDVTAANEEDAVINEITILKKGDYNSSNIAQIYITGEGGTIYGIFNRVKFAKVKIKLKKTLVVAKNSAMLHNIYVKTKQKLWRFGYNSISIGVGSFGERYDPTFGTLHLVIQP